LDDETSVAMGTDMLVDSWLAHASEDAWRRVRSTIAAFNRDDDYIARVNEVMETLAKRVDVELLPAYEQIYA
jgi:hypothetical protein